MGIAIVIAGAVVLTTVAASLFDYLGKRRRGRDPALEAKVAELEKRVESAEARLAERDERLSQLESDLSFVNKLIEDKR